MIVNLFYLIVGIIVALLIASWLYYFKKRNKLPVWLFLLRFFSVLALVLLLFNPKWKREIVSIHKPQLFVAVDNSLSIKSVEAIKVLENVLNYIKNNNDLSDKFDIQYLSFGNEVQILDTLLFRDSETNFYSLFAQINPLGKTYEKIPTLLLTDGNQTKGNDYSYYTGKNPVYPIVLGDTTQYADVSISQLNVNQYSFLDNQFPVEVFVNYTGKGAVNTELSVYRNNQRVFQRKISLNTDQNFQNISFSLKSEQIGASYYTASLSTIKGEKNLKNNRKDFLVEVIDQQSKIALISSLNHPDLGVLKQSIESNKQRKVDLIVPPTNTTKLTDYQFVILYQPTTEMATLFKDLDAQKKNYFVITGTQTDWNFLNKTQPHFYKNPTNLKENFQGVYNINYPNFSLQNFNLEHLPPLQDVFGEISFKTKYETLFYQMIGSTTLETPLLATFSTHSSNHAVLFGEGLWKWKMWSKNETKNLESFDRFVNAIVQYLSATDKNEQLKLFYPKLIYSNQTQIIKAQYFDQNFQLDSRVNLTLQLTDRQKNTIQKIPFTVQSLEFQVSLYNLEKGDYSFTVLAEGKNVGKSGNFRVLDYSIEDQFIGANYYKLNLLASNTGGKIAMPNQMDQIIDELLKNTTYKNIQKSTKKITPLIDWKLLLAIIIVSLCTEWFIRKYRGLI